MSTRFRISKNDTLKCSLFSESGKLLTQIYDSGFSTILEVKNLLLKKCCNPPKKTKFSIYNEDKNIYFSNR